MSVNKKAVQDGTGLDLCKEGRTHETTEKDNDRQCHNTWTTVHKQEKTLKPEMPMEFLPFSYYQ